MKTLTLNNQNLEATISGNASPVLVDFWAEWCGPCKMIAPVLNKLAAEQDGKAVIAKPNIDEAPELAARFGITAIPTLIVFKNGQPVTTLRGAQSESVILKSLTAAATN
jgi:thioredoxin 1